MAAKRKKRTAKLAQVEVTWAQAFRDITIRLIDKGAILPGTISAIVLLLVFRLESQDAKELLDQLLLGFMNYSLVGWSLALVVILFWQSHSRRLRKAHSYECARLGREKSKLQRQLAGVRLGSSDSR